MSDLNKKLAEFAFGLDNVRLTWGCTDFDTGQFIPNLEACILQATYQNEQALCYLHSESTYWQIAPDFPDDLSACFKWFEKPLVDHFIETTDTEDEYRVAYFKFMADWLEDYIWNEPHKPALSFSKAVEKLIDAKCNT